jgi:alkanesulfonate monooxygenase
MRRGRLTIIGTCPTYTGSADPRSYVDDVSRSVRLAENNGWSGVLVYTDHNQLDPWSVANIVVRETQRLTPLVAVQPLYSHPFTIAKIIATTNVIYGRRIDINLVSGGHPRDLEAFCDDVDHSARYRRVLEYGAIIQLLLTDPKPISFQGEFYQISGLQLRPHPHALGTATRFTMSGSSAEGMETARKLGALPIQYLRPVSGYASAVQMLSSVKGGRLGIIARETSSAAWEIARQRYPVDPLNAEIRRYYERVSDSVWVRELAQEIIVPDGHPYWLHPYRTNKSSCPFLVGSIKEVAAELAGYAKLGISTFLLEAPVDEEDISAINSVFDAAEVFLGADEDDDHCSSDRGHADGQ